MSSTGEICLKTSKYEETDGYEQFGSKFLLTSAHQRRALDVSICDPIW